MLQRILYLFVKTFYTILWIAALPLVIIRLWLKGQKLPAYKERLLERFGINSLPKLEQCIWIHAVSVGETEVAKNIILEYKKQQPNTQFFVSTTTPTGSDNITKSELADFHSYIPYDIPFLLNRLIKKINPKALIIIETELWPNLIDSTSKHCPVAIVNARLSEKSFKGYQKADFIITEILKSIALISCSDEDSEQRFKQFGFRNQLQAPGNIKFDNIKINKPIKTHQQPRWIAASTHEGEEQMALEIQQKLIKSIPESQLLLAPRHPDRFKAVEKLIQDSELSYDLISKHSLEDSQACVILLDEMGKLKSRYAQVDIAFVGGSLVNNGGHNMIEPIAAGTPTIMGPYFRNFRTIVERLKQRQAITMVDNPEQLQQQLISFFKQPETFKTQLSNGQAMIQDEQGATRATCMSISQLIKD